MALNGRLQVFLGASGGSRHLNGMAAPPSHGVPAQWWMRPPVPHAGHRHERSPDPDSTTPLIRPGQGRRPGRLRQRTSVIRSTPGRCLVTVVTIVPKCRARLRAGAGMSASRPWSSRKCVMSVTQKFAFMSPPPSMPRPHGSGWDNWKPTPKSLSRVALSDNDDSGSSLGCQGSSAYAIRRECAQSGNALCRNYDAARARSCAPRICSASIGNNL
jgi:hypothetical protein